MTAGFAALADADAAQAELFDDGDSFGDETAAVAHTFAQPEQRMASNGLARLDPTEASAADAGPDASPLSAAFASSLAAALSNDITAQVAAGGVIDLPVGDFTLSEGQLIALGNIVLRGAGPNKTVIHVVAEGPLQPLFSVRGSDAAPVSVQISDLTFDAAGQRLTGLRIDGAVDATLSRVEFRSFAGSAIDIGSVHHAVFNDCHFNQCGDAVSDRPAVLIQPTPGTPAPTGIVFLACQFEPSNYVSMRLGRGANGVSVVACKFHGWLPTPGPWDHLQLIGAFGNVIAGTNFANGGGASILLDGAHHNTLQFNQIARSQRQGIRLVDYSNDNVLQSNALSVGFDTPNTTDVTMDATSRVNVVAANLARRGAQLGLPNASLPIAADINGTVEAILTALCPQLPPASSEEGSGIATDITDVLAHLVATGGSLELPAGVFTVHRSLGVLLPDLPFTLRGQGMGRTIVRVIDNLDGPLFSIQGNDQRLNRWFDFRDLTLDGAGHNLDAVVLERATLGNFTRVEFRDFRGSAIVGKQFWDTAFVQCQFNRCGDAAEQEAAVELGQRDRAVTFTNSNNIYFLSCSFNDNAFTSLLLDTKTTKVRLLNNVFTADPAERPVAGRATYNNVFLGNRIADCAGSVFDLQDSPGNLLGGVEPVSLPVVPPPDTAPPPFIVTPPPTSSPPPVSYPSPAPQIDRDYVLLRLVGSSRRRTTDDVVHVASSTPRASDAAVLALTAEFDSALRDGPSPRRKTQP